MVHRRLYVICKCWYSDRGQIRITLTCVSKSETLSYPYTQREFHECASPLREKFLQPHIRFLLRDGGLGLTSVSRKRSDLFFGVGVK